MIVRQLLPDESFEGYAGQLLASNGVASIPELTRKLLRVGPSRAAGALNRLSVHQGLLLAVAQLHDLSGESVARSHTLLPLIGLLWTTWQQRAQFLQLTGTLWLCRKCSDEDMAFRGISYWRRIHQLEGITWCLKHQCSLIPCRAGIGGLVHSTPYEAAMGVGTVMRSEPVLDETSERYAEIVTSLLDCADRPLNRVVLGHVLRLRLTTLQATSPTRSCGRNRTRARALGNGSALAEVKNVVMKLVEQGFGGWFERDELGRAAQIDRFLFRHARYATAYHLAATMTFLWDDAPTALNEVMQAMLADPLTPLEETECAKPL